MWGDYLSEPRQNENHTVVYTWKLENDICRTRRHVIHNTIVKCSSVFSYWQVRSYCCFIKVQTIREKPASTMRFYKFLNVQTAYNNNDVRKNAIKVTAESRVHHVPWPRKFSSSAVPPGCISKQGQTVRSSPLVHLETLPRHNICLTHQPVKPREKKCWKSGPSKSSGTAIWVATLGSKSTRAYSEHKEIYVNATL